MDDPRLDEHGRRMAKWLGLLQKEAADGGPAGSESARRYAILQICQLARGDAKTALILADNLLDQARRGVDDPTMPTVDFGRIAVPDFMRSQDAAYILRNFTKAAAKRLLDRQQPWWRRAWWRLRAKVDRRYDPYHFEE